MQARPGRSGKQEKESKFSKPGALSFDDFCKMFPFTKRQNSFKAARHFSNIDTDGDLGISVEEAARHVEGDRGRQLARARRPGWFAQIDRNADGVIQPFEFDADLDEESVALFSGRK